MIILGGIAFIIQISVGFCPGNKVKGTPVLCLRLNLNFEIINSFGKVFHVRPTHVSVACSGWADSLASGNLDGPS